MSELFNKAYEYETRGDYENAIRFYLEAAEKGIPEAQYNLANLYYQGVGVQQSYTEALKWYHEAAELGLSEAQFNLALVYEKGEGTEQNHIEAIKWYTKAAEQGDMYAQHNLALIYENGKGVEKDIEKAFELYLMAAERGLANAQYNLALMYDFGYGVEQNYLEAVKWYTAAAEQGDREAQFNLALIYENGKGVEKDIKKAFDLFHMSAELGLSYAQFNLAHMYDHGDGVEQNYNEAMKWYTLSANQGNQKAQFNLALMYKKGEGVEENYSEAVKWYIKAAEQNHSDAQLSLGFIYYEGKPSIAQNYSEAKKWFQASANLGEDPFALFMLGYMYEQGTGVEQNYEEAIKYYTLAYQNDYPFGMTCIASLYEKGEGVEKDMSRAFSLYCKAAEKGDAFAQSQLGNLYEKGEGVKKAPELAVKWWKKAVDTDTNMASTAEYKLGYAYYDGLGAERDLKKSKYYFELAIENGYQCSYALEMVKRELGEEFKDNLMHEYAESIVKKHISNDKLYVRISRDLEKDFGAAWHTMDKESKNFLISGLSTYIIYYSMGAQIFGNLDFSQSIMEMCKALERELGKYLYSGYVEYLKKEKIDPKTFNPKRTFVKKVSASEYDYYSSGDVKKFTLGNLEDTLGIERFMQPMIVDDVGIAKSNKYELKIDETMSSYLDCLFKSDAFSSENRKREIQHYIISLCQEVQSIADSFRNPSAHTNIMKYHRAEVCGNYIIKVKKLLRNFIDKIEEIHQ